MTWIGTFSITLINCSCELVPCNNKLPLLSFLQEASADGSPSSCSFRYVDSLIHLNISFTVCYNLCIALMLKLLSCINLSLLIFHLGSHENIVGYYTSWFENEQLYIQMELCDHSLSINKYSQLSTEGEVLEAMYQVFKWFSLILEI